MVRGCSGIVYRDFWNYLIIVAYLRFKPQNLSLWEVSREKKTSHILISCRYSVGYFLRVIRRKIKVVSIFAPPLSFLPFLFPSFFPLIMMQSGSLLLEEYKEMHLFHFRTHKVRGTKQSEFAFSLSTTDSKNTTCLLVAHTICVFWHKNCTHRVHDRCRRLLLTVNGNTTYNLQVQTSKEIRKSSNENSSTSEQLTEEVYHDRNRHFHCVHVSLR